MHVSCISYIHAFHSTEILRNPSEPMRVFYHLLLLPFVLEAYTFQAEETAVEH